MKRIIFTAIVSLSFFTNCAEDPEPPNKPEVTRADARCRPIGSGGAEPISKLVSVRITVRDLDGAANLGPGRAVAEATTLPLEKEPITGGEPVPGCKDPDGVCEVIYRWERTRDSAQLYCGENSAGLSVQFEVKDEAGFAFRANVGTSLQDD